jgi:hypothetical protein
MTITNAFIGANLESSSGTVTEKQTRLQEVVTSLLALAKVSLYSCNKSILLDCSTLALQLAPPAGYAFEGESYAIYSLACGINGDTTNAEVYAMKAKKVIETQIGIQIIITKNCLLIQIF